MDYQELLTWGLSVFNTLAKFGPLGIASATLMVAINLYKTAGVSSLLPTWMRWSSLSPVAKVLLPVGGSLLAAILAMLGGASASLILPLAAGVAGLTIGGHHVMKRLGEALNEAELKKNPFYDPGPIRRVAALVVPLPKADEKLLEKVP